MNKLKFILIPMLLLTISANTVAGAAAVQNTTKNDVATVDSRQLDPRAKVLANYLSAKDSPLQYHAQDFIDAADEYGVDWKLVPAISGVESTFGKQSYGYNAWGWGIYGDQALGFSSWKTGIYTVTGGLKAGYINKGLTDPLSINKVYAASPTWGVRVNYFMNDLEKFSTTQDKTNINPQAEQLSKIAGNSAQLAFK